MSLHFPLPKIRTFRFSLHTSRLSLHGEVTWRWNSQWVHTFHSQKLFRIWIYTSLAKNSHNWQWDYTFPCQKFALFVSPFTLPVSPFTERSRGAEIRNEFTLSIAKNCFALFVPPLSNGTSRATSDRKPKTNDQILASPILFFPSKNWIKLIPKTIGNRKRDCAWGTFGEREREREARKRFLQLLCVRYFRWERERERERERYRERETEVTSQLSR